MSEDSLALAEWLWELALSGPAKSAADIAHAYRLAEFIRYQKIAEKLSFRPPGR